MFTNFKAPFSYCSKIELCSSILGCPGPVDHAPTRTLLASQDPACADPESFLREVPLESRVGLASDQGGSDKVLPF